jgi:hypothetical protein
MQNLEPCYPILRETQEEYVKTFLIIEELRERIQSICSAKDYDRLAYQEKTRNLKGKRFHLKETAYRLSFVRNLLKPLKYS